jgi:hypothetical protein
VGERGAGAGEELPSNGLVGDCTWRKGGVAGVEIAGGVYSEAETG